MSYKTSFKYDTLELRLTLYVFREDENTVVYSPEVRMQAIGCNADNALASFKQKLHLFILEVHNMNKFEEIFKQYGWKIFKSGSAIECDPPSLLEMRHKDHRFVEILSDKSYSLLNRVLELKTFPEWNIHLN